MRDRGRNLRGVPWFLHFGNIEDRKKDQRCHDRLVYPRLGIYHCKEAKGRKIFLGIMFGSRF